MATISLVSQHEVSVRNQNHYHNILISDINSKILKTVPQNARITKVLLRVNTKVSSALPMCELYCYLGNNAGTSSNNTNLGKMSSDLPTSAKNYDWDLTSYFNSTGHNTYPFTMNTSSTYLIPFWLNDYVFTFEITCKVDLVVDYETPVNITATVSPTGAGTVTGGGAYEYGKSATLEAVPNAGYRFVKWNDNVTTNPRTVTVTSNATYIAYFESIYVTYDTIFSFKKWKDRGIVSSDSTVSNISDTGFTLTSNNGAPEGTASSPYFSVKPGESYRIDIDISGNNWDVYIFFCDIDGNWIDFVDGPTNRFSSYTNWGNTFTAPNKPEVVKAFIRVDANEANNTITYNNFRIFPSNYDYMSDSVSAIERTDAILWSMPTPTRNGYKFLGWYTQINGGGSKYTSSSTFPTTDLVLYSHWELQKYTITFKNWDGTVLQSSPVNHGSTPSYTGVTPTKPATAQYTYTFSGWSPTISTATGDTTYMAQFTATTNTYKITTVVSPTGAGTVTGGNTYSYGSKPTLTATPATGYKFVKWNDGVTTASRTVTVTGAATYTATFEKLPPPKFTSVSMTYLDKQISATNKVTVKESFIISVSVT